MIASNPGLLPAYSSIHAGTTEVTDTIRGSSTSTWARTALKPFRYATYFATQNADFTGSRAVKSNWTLDPVMPQTIAPAASSAFSSTTMPPR
jgi:hypothetical protein